MTQPDHLTEEQFAQYRSRRLAPLELLAVDDHIAQCAPCRDRLFGLERAGSQLRQLRASLAQHLTYDQVAACARGPFPPDAAQHLKECDMCRAEVDDLRQFRTEIVTAPPVPIRMPVRAIPWLAAAAALLLAAGITFLMLRPGAVPAPPQVAVAPKTSEPPLSPEDREAVQLALASHKLERPPILDRLITRRGILMGPNGGAPSFDLTGPQGTAILTDRPVFQWTPAEGASHYQVAIYDENFEKVMEGPAVPGTEWQPGQPLPRDRVLNWQVTAAVRGKTIHAPVPPAPEARFLIVSQETAGQIQTARRDHPENHVLLAALLARAGMLADAQKELDELAATDPATADALRQSLK